MATDMVATVRGTWDWVDREAAAETVLSIEKVRDELIWTFTYNGGPCREKASA